VIGYGGDETGGGPVSVVSWKLVGIAAVVAIAIGLQLPEIRRYLKMRSM
jgi:hypothetical protein